jgi:hypothetical protein
MPDFTCPECTEQGKEFISKTAAGLGGHRKVVHGVQGSSRSTLDGQRRSRRAKPKPLSQANIYVRWLAEHPGPHNITAIGAAIGAEATKVGKSLSASKVRGYPVVNDGRGNWEYTNGAHLSANLPAKVKVVPPEPKPEPSNGQVHFVSQQIVLLLRDSEGREWVASPR